MMVRQWGHETVTYSGNDRCGTKLHPRAHLLTFVVEKRVNKIHIRSNKSGVWSLTKTFAINGGTLLALSTWLLVTKLKKGKVCYYQYFLENLTRIPLIIFVEMLFLEWLERRFMCCERLSDLTRKVFLLNSFKQTLVILMTSKGLIEFE